MVASPRNPILYVESLQKMPSVNEAPRVEAPAVLLVSIATLLGGAETYYIKLADILRERYRLYAVVCNDHLAMEFEAIGVNVVNITRESRGFRRYIAAARAIWRLRSAANFDVVHLNGQPEAYLAPLIRMMGCRVVLTRHTPFTTQFFRAGSNVPAFLKQWIASFCLLLSYRTVCVSRLLKEQLSAVIAADRLVVIPTWVPVRFLNLRATPEPSPLFRLLFVGRVVTNKGIFDLIEAIRLSHGVRLDVVGVGDQLEDAKKAASGLKIDFHGFQEDCIPFYRACDLLVFPAHEGFEGLPQVPLEAMAIGVPCLASNISSMREIAGEDGQAVTWFEVGVVPDLVQKITLLQESPGLREALGKDGAMRVAANFTEQVVRGQYFDLFNKALRRN
jgi:glycosyltransferase involved in cell wall biosynthesis